MPRLSSSVRYREVSGIVNLSGAYWAWCPACNSLAVRPIQGACGVRAFQCAKCFNITPQAPRVEIWVGNRRIHRVVHSADGVYGYANYRGSLKQVRRGSIGWFVIGTR